VFGHPQDIDRPQRCHHRNVSVLREAEEKLHQENYCGSVYHAHDLVHFRVPASKAVMNSVIVQEPILVAPVATSRQDDIAITMGCSAAYASQVASQLDAMSGALPIQGQAGPSGLNPPDGPNPPPPPNNSKNGGKQRKTNPADAAAEGTKAGDGKDEQPKKKPKAAPKEAHR